MNGCGPKPFGTMPVRVGSRHQKYPDWKQLIWLAYRLWDVLISDPPQKTKPRRCGILRHNIFSDVGQPLIFKDTQIGKKIQTRWFKVTFSSPSWRSLIPLKRSLSHPKKVTKNHQVDMVNNPLFTTGFSTIQPVLGLGTIPMLLAAMPAPYSTQNVESKKSHGWMVDYL